MPLIVNGRRIEDTVLDAEFTQIKSYHERMHNVSCCERDPEFRQTARDNVIGRVLLADEALRTTDPAPEADVDAALEKLKTEHGGEAHFYANLGIAPEQVGLVRQDLDVSLRVNTLMERLVAGDPQPTDQELRDYYNAHIATFTNPEERRASHISRGVSRMASREGLLDDFAALREQILDGADFDTLARQHSDRGADLIDLGYFRRGDLPEEVEMVAFSMRAGEISPVFSSSVGVHILKLTDIRKPAARSFDQCREQLRQLLHEDKKRARAQELVTRLRATATIQELDAEVGQEDGVIPEAHTHT